MAKVTINHHIEVDGRAQAHLDRTIGRELGVDPGKLREFFEQQVALVEQVGRLCVLALLLGELFIDQGQVSRKTIDLSHCAFQGLQGFNFDQVELRRELAEAFGDALCLAHECAAHNRGRCIARQGTASQKKLV